MVACDENVTALLDVLWGCVTGRYWMCYDAVLQDVTGVLYGKHLLKAIG